MIRRFNPDGNGMAENPDGRWVTYEDHLSALAQQDQVASGVGEALAAVFENASEWPRCPSEVRDAPSWIAGRDATVRVALRAFDAALDALPPQGQTGVSLAAEQARDALVRACNEGRDAQAKAIEDGICVLSDALASRAVEVGPPSAVAEKLRAMAEDCEVEARRTATVHEAASLRSRATRYRELADEIPATPEPQQEVGAGLTGEQLMVRVKVIRKDIAEALSLLFPETGRTPVTDHLTWAHGNATQLIDALPATQQQEVDGEGVVRAEALKQIDAIEAAAQDHYYGGAEEWHEHVEAAITEARETLAEPATSPSEQGGDEISAKDLATSVMKRWVSEQGGEVAE